MEVRTLGKLAALGCSSCDEGPPSSQSILALYRREPGALMRVAGSTLMRSVLIAPGVGLAAYLSGARGGRLAAVTVGGSLVSALGITGFLLAYYAFKGQPAAPQVQPMAAGGAEASAPTVIPTAPAPQLSPTQLVPDAMRDSIDTAVAAASQSPVAVSAQFGSNYGAQVRFAGASFGRRPFN